MGYWTLNSTVHHSTKIGIFENWAAAPQDLLDFETFFGGMGTMGHFKVSSHANLMFKNGTKLTTITTTTTIGTIKQQQQQHTIPLPNKIRSAICYCCLQWEGISTFKRARELLGWQPTVEGGVGTDFLKAISFARPIFMFESFVQTNGPKTNKKSWKMTQKRKTVLNCAFFVKSPNLAKSLKFFVRSYGRTVTPYRNQHARG